MRRQVERERGGSIKRKELNSRSKRKRRKVERQVSRKGKRAREMRRERQHEGQKGRERKYLCYGQGVRRGEGEGEGGDGKWARSPPPSLPPSLVTQVDDDINRWRRGFGGAGNTETRTARQQKARLHITRELRNIFKH